MSENPLDNLPFDFSCAEEGITGMHPLAYHAICQVAQEYATATGQRLMLNSAYRTLRHTASLMAGFSIEQLEGMYCRHGYPSYIQSMKDRILSKGNPLTEEEAYCILSERTEGYISSHLYGGAVDIDSERVLDRTLLEQLLAKHGFSFFDETSLGVACFHATHTNVPKIIVKK